MFIAMNRFRIAPGQEAAFEDVWRKRETFLETVPGFQSFRLLKGPQSEEASLYVSHSCWDSKAAFEGWTKSEQFRKAHAQAGANRELYLGPPQFEGFETIIEQTL